MRNVEEVTDEPLYRDRVCGIDIGKAQMVATIRVPSDSNPARRASETRSFGTAKREVLALADWLRELAGARGGDGGNAGYPGCKCVEIGHCPGRAVARRP